MLTALGTRNILSQVKTKEAEPLQPSLKVCTFAQREELFLLYAAAGRADHLYPSQ